ncbi:hypothetical protein CIG75_14970 [Tumebacillus algifaecis]|uniref:Nudix hydrolase domain-containing protein n=1 Tax=Tumebacillus algifaecis TaxID=1214604 RepID=A0A223D3E7_9BACL|nr:hypothetical protein [Tumebacillus algifaecis]ASS76132.1 hypothetical protein CIG75_14970 [Tumebacillus algifaecis]
MQEQEMIVQAATTIFVRDKKEGGLETYLTKRPDTMRFLPGHYVFPGGTMDESDQDPRLAAHAAPIASEQNPDKLPLAYWMTALRESFEEAGILLARDPSGRLVNPEELQEQREKLLQGEVSFYEVIAGSNLQLATDLLRYFGHRITPRRVSKRRFETRFFLMVLPDGMEPIPHTGEIVAAGWTDAATALEKWSSGDYQMVPPTVQALRTLDRFQEAQSLWSSTEGVGKPTLEELA